MALFSDTSLNLMPTPALTGLSNALTLKKGDKEIELATKNTKIAKLQGISTLRTPVNGRLSVNTDSGAQAAEKSMATPAKSFANGASVLTNPGTNPSQVPVFVPGTVPQGTTTADVDAMSDEIGAFFDTTNEPQAPATSAKIATLQQQRSQLQNEVQEIDTTLEKIAVIIAGRASGDLPNPVLNLSALNLEGLPGPVEDRIKKAVDDNQQFINNQIVAPFVENQRLLKSLVSEVSGGPGLTPVFDLEFGPPISSNNKFILSEDGLYYDSRNAEVPTVLSDPVSSTMWDLQFDSNKGGRGESFSEKDGNDDEGTIFDLDISLQEENPRVKDFYRFDDVLQQFEDDKQSQITEVSGYIAHILATGYQTSDALIQSYYGQLGAVGSVYEAKIRKRKRQLAIAALYGRNTFFVTDRNHPLGEGLFFQYKPAPGKAFEYKLPYKDVPDREKSISFFELEGGSTLFFDTKTEKVVDTPRSANILSKLGVWKQIPRIPINDFSYLKESDIPLKEQKRITLFSEDLDSIIAPYQAKYVVAPPNIPNNSVENLAVDMIGYGDWVHRETSANLSATTPLYKSLTDDIVADNLLICYNFLDPGAITQPSGTLYALNNAAEGSPRLDGKLVGYDKSFVFPSGVGAAYFGGTIFDERAMMNELWADVKGSYVRLPNITKEYPVYNVPYKGVTPLDNLFYSKKGVTLDFWAFVPKIHTDMTNYHRYRLAFACENSGPVATDYVNAGTQGALGTRQGATTGATNENRTIGLIVGWRDKGSPEDSPSPYGSSGLEFCIAPTVGQNQNNETDPNKSWGHSVCIAEKWGANVIGSPPADSVTEVGMYIPSGTASNGYRTSSGYGIQDVSGGYHHISITFNYEEDEVKFHLDGELLATSSVTNTLGGNPNNTVLPTATKIFRDDQSDTIDYNDPTVESYLGNTIYDERATPERVAFPVFTPWIIGGGYTDTIPKIPGTTYRPMGFLGSNTNNTHQNSLPGADVSTITVAGAEFPAGQHIPPLSSGKGATGSTLRQIPRSGLDGFLGSFKIYSKPLTTDEAKENYDAQRAFFQNILLSSP